MAQKPVPRRSPGVSVRVGKSTRNADTRDARDDATIIAWLQRIDMDVLKASTKPVVASNRSPGGGAPTPSGTLEDQVRQAGTSVTGFVNAVELARRATIALGVALHPSFLVGAIQGMREGLRRLVGLALPVDVERTRKVATEAQDLYRKAFTQANVARQRETQAQAKARRLGALATQAAQQARLRPSVKNRRRARKLAAQATAAASKVPQLGFRAQRLARSAGSAFKVSQAASGAAASTAASASTSLISGVGMAVGASGPAAPIVGAAVAIVAATTAIIASVPLLKIFAESIFEANRSLAEFSPMMAIVMARAQIADTMRGIKTGEAVAPSAGKLQEALAELKDALQPLTISIRVLANIFAIGLAKIATFLTSVVFAPITSILAEIARRMDELISRGQVDAVGLAEWATDIAQETTRRRGFGPLPSQRRNP